jgi:ParB family chromosome partitioning protein
MTDDEALELQIIENLQRKDVHPMEEAVAFKSLIERKQHPLTIEEIAARIGKTTRFVNQRLKLNSLVKVWQDAYFSNALQAVDAIRIAAMEPQMQSKLAEEINLKAQSKNQHQIEINEYTYNNFLGDLKNPPFDTKDETLSPKFGACTNCPYNSAAAALFPGDEKHPKCTNRPDYKLKVEEAFKRNLALANEDPAIALISTQWYGDEKEKTEFEKKGNRVYSREEYTEVGKDSKDFHAKLEAGKYLKAFVVIGNDRGRFLHVQINPKKAASDTRKAVADKEKEGKLTVADIIAEIARINDREKRTKEIDQEKIHKNIVDHLKDHDAFKKPGIAMTKSERALLVFLVYTKLDYSNKTSVLKSLGLKEDQYSSKQPQRDFFKQLEKVDDTKLAYLLRRILLHEYQASGPFSAGGTALRILAEALGDVPIKKLELDQEGVSSRRQERIASRITALQNKKKELQAAAKPQHKESKKKPPQKKVE